MAAPQYVYDPITQSYKLVQQPIGQQPTQTSGLGALYPSNSGGDGTSSMGTPGTGTPGSGGTIGDMALSAYGATTQAQEALGPFAIAVPGLGMVNAISTMGVDKSMDVNEQVDQDLATLAEQANVSTVTQGPFGPVATGQVNISPVAAPMSPTVTAIAPSQTAGLQALNAQAQQEAEEAPDDISTALAAISTAPDAVAAAAQAAAAQAAADAQAAATAASDSGPATATGAGEASDASVSGANSEASHSADGNNSGDGSSGGGCFLTTAATRYMGQPDNGPVLSALRNFRDTYMRKDKEKSKDVDWYYTNAPRIMQELDKRKDAPEVYREMYKEYIYPAYKAIKEGNKVEAYTIYKALVNFAKRKSGIENDELTPKPKHMADGGIASIARDGMNYQGGGYASPNYYPYSQPTMMAEGGLAAAKRTQDAGRGPDTMLVHMAPQEVAGLQALAMAHGGSLTINPKTGLPEAGFLSSLLPTLVGAALTVGSQGAINPYMAAAIVGGGTTLATGSLKKGLFAGLGAFGGGNIGEGLSAAAGTELVTPATPAVSPATQITPDIAQPGAQFIEPPDATFFSRSSTPLLESTGRGPFAGVNSQYNVIPTETYETVISPVSDQAGQFIVDRPPMAGASNWQSTVVPEAGRMPPVENARDALLARGEPMQVATYGGPTNFERAGKGLQNIFAGGEEGKAARTLFGEKAGYGSFSAAASPILNAEPEPLAKKKSYIRPYDLDVVNRSAEMAPLYGPGSTSGREMVSYNFSPRPIYEAAAGGLMDISRDGYAAGGLTAFAAGKEVKRPKKLGGDPYYKFSHSRKDTSMEAALDANFAKGGAPRYLNGKGDGMSDDIPAIIDGKQPARLADGEFVVPADVVSHLGNGSSKAGAKKLYSMMDRIRKARTGKKSQAPAVKSERYMPA